MRDPRLEPVVVEDCVTWRNFFHKCHRFFCVGGSQNFCPLSLGLWHFSPFQELSILLDVLDTCENVSGLLDVWVATVDVKNGRLTVVGFLLKPEDNVRVRGSVVVTFAADDDPLEREVLLEVVEQELVVEVTLREGEETIASRETERPRHL